MCAERSYFFFAAFASAFSAANPRWMASRKASDRVASTLADWVVHGFDQYMAIGNYDAAPSANFNNSQFLDALDIRHGDDLLFPIYKTITGPGSGAQYDIVGWVGFNVTSITANGSKGVVRGKFTKVIWEGIQSTSGGGLNYGAVAIQLVE